MRAKQVAPTKAETLPGLKTHQNSSGRQKPKRCPAGTKALEEIENYQRSTDLLIPRAPFQRLARDVLQEMEKGLTFTPEALESLQKAAEHYITKIFETCVHVRNSAGRRTLMVSDIKLVLGVMIPKWIRWSEDEIFDMS